VISEVYIHGLLAPLLLAEDKAEQHGERAYSVAELLTSWQLGSGERQEGFPREQLLLNGPIFQ
jgi:hypothetical protein